MFIKRNEYPKSVEQVWVEIPKEGSQVEVQYTKSTNKNVWFVGGKFVNKYGFELHNINGWRYVHK